MLGNFLFAILGWFLGFLTPANLWQLPWVRDARARKTQKKLERILAEARGQLTLGSFQIDRIATVQVFEPTLSSDDIVCHFDSVHRKLPPDLDELETDYLPVRVRQLKEQKKTVDFNDHYALRSLRIERPQESGNRKNRPELRFEPSNFKYYLMVNEALDKQLLQDDHALTSIRSRHLARFEPFQWSNLESVPFHMWFATVTAVITAERQLVVAIRSELQAITDGQHRSDQWRAAMSCAEGMLRPVDSRCSPPSEDPSPFCTAARSLQDELGIVRGKHVSESDLRLLGIGFDTLRFQPIGVFTVDLALGFMDVFKLWQTAKDRQENYTLLPVPLTPRDVAHLLNGQVRHEDRPVRLFSNHQQLGVLLAGIHHLGYSAMSGALK